MQAKRDALQKFSDYQRKRELIAKSDKILKEFESLFPVAKHDNLIHDKRLNGQSRELLDQSGQLLINFR